MSRHLNTAIAVLFALLIFVCPAFGAADDINRLFTFAPGQTIQSSQFNQEFNQLINTMNGKFGRSVANTVSGNNIFSGDNTFSGTNTFSGVVSFSNVLGLKADVVSEYTSASGVTIDSVRLKDGMVKVAGTPASAGEIGYSGGNLTFYNGTTVKTVGTTDLFTGWPSGYITGKPVAYVSASTVKIQSGTRVRSSDDTTNIQFDADANCVLSSSGAGGLDTGSEASNTWYYEYAIEDVDTGTEACLLSTVNESVTGAITMPSGYDVKRQMPMAIRNDASSNIIPFFVGEGWPNRPVVFYNVAMADHTSTAGPTNVFSGTMPTTYTDVDLSSFVPPISRMALLHISRYGTTQVSNYRPKGETHDGFYLVGGNSTSQSNNLIIHIGTDSSRVIQHKMSSGDNAKENVYGYVVTEMN